MARDSWSGAAGASFWNASHLGCLVTCVSFVLGKGELEA
jgi:hypothetical protein